MALRFAKVSEEEIVAINEAPFFYPSDLVNTKTTIPLRVCEERWIYALTLRVSVYIHHYSPPLRGILVKYISYCAEEKQTNYKFIPTDLFLCTIYSALLLCIQLYFYVFSTVSRKLNFETLAVII